MALHTQPDEIAKLNGAHKLNPQRYRKTIPKSDKPCGNPPEDMSEEAQACWFEISAKAIPGVLTYADTIMLELASDLLAEYRQVRKIRNDAFLLPAEMVEERALALKIVFTSTNKTILIGLLARFGMSPSDRNSLGIAEKKVDDPFAHLDD
jgi:hypothetical protein